jgi:tRNA(fMet)-specific endonuclease VapC
VDVREPTHYLLDTNMVGYIVSGRSQAARKAMVEGMDHARITISTITEAEILYGLARRPEATRLRAAVEALLEGVEILAWDSEAAMAYGTLRARLAAAGKSLSAMDMLITAHAVATDAILVTRDAAFLQVESLRPVVNWATDL